MAALYSKYLETGFDKNGVLNVAKPKYPDTFNFGYDVMDEMARLEPDKTAMVWCNEHGEEKFLTYRQLSEYSNKAANLFTRLGIKKGDKVMLILKRHYQYWFAILALHKLGAVTIPATNLLTVKDLVYRYQAASVSATVCTADGEISDHVVEAQKQCPEMKLKMIVHGSRDGFVDFDEEIEKESAEFKRVKTHVHEPMLLYFTSGTTGYPKMVIHDHTYALAHIVTGKFWHKLDEDSLHLTVSETGWGKAAWGKLYGQWFSGSAIFVYDFDKFNPVDLLHMIQKYRITSFCAPPTIFRFFIKEGLSNFDISSLKHATIAGEALNPEVYNRFYEYTGLKLMEGFGQTETTLLVANLPGMEPKPGSMGKPTPQYHVDVVDENGNSAAAGEVGEIVVRTGDAKPGEVFGLFMGYYRDEERTKQAWHDGLFHTGDTAWRDEDGYLWYVGRTDDLIKSSGYRIGPFEIESVLIQHPAVLECAITGVPDPVRGQVVKATVVLTKNYQPSGELVKELQDYVKHQTAPYKYPRVIEFVAELPKTISGKIKRVDIRNSDSSAGK